MRLYHGNGEVAQFPEIRRGRFTKWKGILSLGLKI